MDGSSFLAAFASAGSADGQKSTLNSKSPNNEEVIHFNGLLDSFPVKGKQVNPSLEAQVIQPPLCIFQMMSSIVAKHHTDPILL